MAQGNDGKGNKMTTMLSKAAAEAAVKAGTAKMGKQFYFTQKTIIKSAVFIIL